MWRALLPATPSQAADRAAMGERFRAEAAGRATRASLPKRPLRRGPGRRSWFEPLVLDPPGRSHPMPPYPSGAPSHLTGAPSIGREGPGSWHSLVKRLHVVIRRRHNLLGLVFGAFPLCRSGRPDRVARRQELLRWPTSYGCRFGHYIGLQSRLCGSTATFLAPAPRRSGMSRGASQTGLTARSLSLTTRWSPF
jgi:hypothetical protein